MTLAISFFDPKVSDPEDNFRGMAEMPRDLFGFESWRRVWGSEVILSKGGYFLFKLRNEDLFVYPDELSSFHQELLLIISQLDDISSVLKIPSADMKFRLNNAVLACDFAKEKGYGVCIS